MKRIRIFIIGLVLAAISAGGFGCSSVAPEGAAADFTLESIDGETYTLSDFSGRPVVLNFFATWCGPCQLEAPHFATLQSDPDWQEEELVLLAVDLRESGERVRQFMDYFGLEFPALLDRTGETGAAYNVSSIPATFFIDKNGIIQSIKIGAFTSYEELETRIAELVNAGE